MDEGKYSIDKKIYFIIVVLLSLYRMFLYMRFFRPLSYLFTMFSYVLIDITRGTTPNVTSRT